MNANKLAFLFGDSIEADYAFKRELLLAEEEAKEERWKENEERMKENEERMKEYEERMKENEERMKHLKQLHQQAILNIMKTFNVSEKDALALFSQTI